MQCVVLDASVLLKWVLPSAKEAHVEQALALQTAIAVDEIRACVPTLWFYEVANSLARQLPDSASFLLDQLRAFDLDEIGMDAELQRIALQLVRECGVTFYDASYHAIAIAQDGMFVTSDARHIERTRTVGHVAHLADWPLPA